MARTPFVSFKTITPIEVAPLLKTGVNDTTPGFKNLLTELLQLHPDIHLYNQPKAQQYTQLDQDETDIRLLSWPYDEEENGIEFHLYQSGIAIAEMKICVPIDTAENLEAQVQTVTRNTISKTYPKFNALLKKASKIPSALIDKSINIYTEKPNILWTARILAIDSKFLNMPLMQQLIREWLKDTRHPEDADSILDRKLDHSMTWLNYVVVEKERKDWRIETMLLAQFFYAAQEANNRKLKYSISASHIEKDLTAIHQLLSSTRTNARLHQVLYYEHLKLLTRRKRQLLRDILDGWEFPLLVENSERMIDICSSHLKEAENKKRERGNLLTDLLLVSLSFFAVFELCLYLVELSREMMSRPTLDYNDDNTSFFLSSIAAIDTDIMFSLGIGLTLLLALAYKLIKEKL